MRDLIKVGFCIAYDWELLAYAIPRVYKFADSITISIDKNRQTWAGNVFDFNQNEFFTFIQKNDPDGKINVYEDTFYLNNQSTAQNEVRQRNLLAQQMGKGGWHIQIDCDEYFVDFELFINYLHSLPDKSYPFNVCCPLATLFKQVEDSFIYIQPDSSRNIEFIQIATREPNYQYGRRNGNFNIYTNHLLIHQSWARSESEIRLKIDNWGHNLDFNRESFLQFWLNLNGTNYASFKNFHPIKPTVWSTLKIVKSEDINGLINHFKKNRFTQLSDLKLFLSNSIYVSRLRKLINTLFGK
jgi:hypothetical protein